MATSPPDSVRQERLQTLKEIAHVDEEVGVTLLEACNWNVEEAVDLHFAGGVEAGLPPQSQAPTSTPSASNVSGSDFLALSRPVEVLERATAEGNSPTPGPDPTTEDPPPVGWFGSFTRRLTDISQSLLGVASEDFQDWFESRYGQPVPPFAKESFGDASKSAMESGKLLLLWFHQEDTPASEALCRKILQNEMMVEIMSRSFLMWGGDVCRYEAGTLARLLDITVFPTLIIGQPMRPSLEEFTTARVALEWPLGNFVKPLVSLSPPSPGEEIPVDEALAAIASIAEDHQSSLQAREAQVIARNMQFEEDRRLREQQDREFEEALLADQLRAIAETEEAAKSSSPAASKADAASPAAPSPQAEATPNEQAGGSTSSSTPGTCSPDNEVGQTAQVDEEAEAERVKKGLEIMAKPEPTQSDGAVAKLMLRLPSGERLQRAFLATETLEEVYDWAHCCRSRADPWTFELWTNFPAKGLTDRSATLQSLGLVPNAALVLKALDS
mmetsp:Transcript_57683/g.122726  ORF Transcript_57683/g.122726 Transcript_57683/m.122726 type:complete len:500 (-) Transcript_57683:38-1537(-)